MSEHAGLWEQLTERDIERLRLRKQKGVGAATRITAARPEGDWLDIATFYPQIPAWLAIVEEHFFAGGHERLDLINLKQPQLRMVCAVHDTSDGPGAGGLRRHDPVTDPVFVIEDTMNLARSMTYKNRAAGVGRGGSKLCLHTSPIPAYDRDQWLLDIKQEIELSGTITGPDTGFALDDLRALSELTPLVTGVRGEGTGGSAAIGVHAALVAAAASMGSALSELHLSIMGMGTLGANLGRLLLKDGARLTVCDKDYDRIDGFLSALPAQERTRIGIVAPYQILEVACDILVPCAVGGLFNEENANRLFCRAICGGANNQLASRSLGEDLSIARALHRSGVLYVPDWLAGAGGTIHGTMEFREGEAFDPRKVHARIHRICGTQVDELLDAAKRSGRPPLELALESLVGNP